MPGKFPSVEGWQDGVVAMPEAFGLLWIASLSACGGRLAKTVFKFPSMEGWRACTTGWFLPCRSVFVDCFVTSLS